MGLLVGGLLEDENLDVFIVVEIIHDDVGKFRHGAGTDVADDVVLIFVHEEERVGIVEIAVETAIDFGHFDGIVALGDGLGVVENFVAAAFEIAAPVGDLFGEFGAARDNDFFHD